MVLEALLKGIKSSEPTDKVVLVSNYTGAARQPPQVLTCWSTMPLRLKRSAHQPLC
jgi:hypothetical protein